ncbi:uncharacterized protein BYT42DRAFT_211291 [Radiomyces spectabilis]|uniref:uncharacterized protein n=1 Tax=Radiomyces spectabilis TaxID=64574 RepID=UPI00221F21DB|nr:uncharacterized protein BYT42DRAFT_211291 [Radiomyces spectabilis]KAI8391846.1 hypothetical protein BYT42DRAFT_211291 [Radiomyces spectabilis]
MIDGIAMLVALTHVYGSIRAVVLFGFSFFFFSTGFHCTINGNNSIRSAKAISWRRALSLNLDQFLCLTIHG